MAEFDEEIRRREARSTPDLKHPDERILEAAEKIVDRSPGLQVDVVALPCRHVAVKRIKVHECPCGHKYRIYQDPKTHEWLTRRLDG